MSKKTPTFEDDIDQIIEEIHKMPPFWCKFSTLIYYYIQKSKQNERKHRTS